MKKFFLFASIVTMTACSNSSSNSAINSDSSANANTIDTTGNAGGVHTGTGTTGDTSVNKMNGSDTGAHRP